MTENPNNSEIIEAINTTVDEKMDNPTVVRRRPTMGIFVLDDGAVSGHSHPSRVDIEREDGFKRIRFSESFLDATPRHKPPVLIYSYEIDQGAIVLLPYIDDDQSPLEKQRLEQLLEDVTLLPPTEDEEPCYSPLKPHLQRVLDSLKTMRIIID